MLLQIELCPMTSLIVCINFIISNIYSSGFLMYLNSATLNNHVLFLPSRCNNFFLFFFSVIFFLVFDLFLPNWLLFPMLNRWYSKDLISILSILGENVSIFHAQIWGVSKVFSYTFLTWKQFHSIHNFLIGFVCNQSCYHFTIFLSMEWENF